MRVGCNMKFYNNLYMTRFCERKKNKLCRRLKSGKGPITIFVIILAEGTDLLEIHHATFLRQSYFRHRDILVMGFAETHARAVKLCTRIVLDLYKDTGDFNIRSYSEGKFME